MRVSGALFSDDFHLFRYEVGEEGVYGVFVVAYLFFCIQIHQKCSSSLHNRAVKRHFYMITSACMIIVIMVVSLNSTF